MSEPERAPTAEEEHLVQSLLERDLRAAFGPSFFLGPLARFVRDRCPDPVHGLPHVSIHLYGGEVLDLCHVVGLAPRFIALAVWSGPEMHTEIVPYETIVRIAVRPAGRDESHVGFNQEHPPALQASPEQTLRAASRSERDAGDGSSA